MGSSADAPLHRSARPRRRINSDKNTYKYNEEAVVQPLHYIKALRPIVLLNNFSHGAVIVADNIDPGCFRQLINTGATQSVHLLDFPVRIHINTINAALAACRNRIDIESIPTIVPICLHTLFRHIKIPGEFDIRQSICVKIIIIPIDFRRCFCITCDCRVCAKQKGPRCNALKRGR